MKHKALILLNVMLGATILGCLTLIAWAFAEPNARAAQDGLEQVGFIGTYAVDQNLTGAFSDQNHTALPGGGMLRATGRLSTDIEKNQTLLLYLRNVEAEVLLNGVPLLSVTREDCVPHVSNSTGCRWVSLVSPGITTEDLVEITLISPYPQDGEEAFNGFFQRMYTGSEWALSSMLLKEDLLSLLIGLGISIFGFTLLLASLAGLFYKIEQIRSLLSFGGLCVVGGMAIFLEQNYVSATISYPAALNLLQLLCRQAMGVFLCLFVRAGVTEKARNMMHASLALATLTLLCGGVLQAAGLVDIQAFTPYGSAVTLLVFLASLSALLYESRRRHKKSAYLTFLSLLPLCVAGVLNTANYYLGIWDVRAGFDLGILFFVCMQMMVLMYTIEETAKRSLKLENELLQNRVAMMLSQIQPHFLFNSLTAIKQLCAIDPKRAEECVGSFASYLRTNLDSLSKSALIPLSKELSHTQQYLKLEQMRFGERVKVAYDLRYTGFSLPSLTLQPLVENAVRYGITKKPKGGTVIIFADETDEAYIVRVSDDGVGFDQQAALSTDRSHIGIENVKSRLNALCGGQLEVVSKVGEGTVATISIPKREASEE